jgi:Flp pilus assembly protein TadG
MRNLSASYAFMRTLLGVRMDRLREARAAHDRGASAVELAIITAVILVIAGIILAAINTFVTNKSNQINGGG